MEVKTCTIMYNASADLLKINLQDNYKFKKRFLSEQTLLTFFDETPMGLRRKYQQACLDEDLTIITVESDFNVSEQEISELDYEQPFELKLLKQLDRQIRLIRLVCDCTLHFSEFRYTLTSSENKTTGTIPHIDHVIWKTNEPFSINDIVAVILCVALGFVGIMIYAKYQISKIPELTFLEALEYTTKDNADAAITVGIIKDGELSYKVYGENGKELSAELHTYEIGSITKTFTAALINKSINEGKINIDNTIDCYLPLPNGNKYPAIKELLTHTSGYKGYYFESPMISNFFMGRNDFCGITKEMVLDKTSNLNMDRESYSFTYSNYGYAVLGLVLEAVYDTDYTTLVNDFLQNGLGLTDTKISDRSGDLGNYWDW